MDPMMGGPPPGGADPMMDPMGGGMPGADPMGMPGADPMGMPGADPMGMPGADPMGMPPMPGEAGAPMDMAGAPPGGEMPDERPLKPKGYRGKMVFWSLGPTTHSFLCWSFLGTATFLLAIAVLGTPQIKPIAFATGQIPGTQSKMYIGWLGSCIGDEDTKWSTCTPPSFPLSISNFGQLEGRLAEVNKIFDRNSIKALAFNAAAAFFTLVATLMHRIGRNHGPFYLTVFAFVLTLLAFIVDAIIFYPSLKQLEENAGLEASLGLGCTAVGISVSCLFLGCFVSYSRAVKAQLNWPAHDPHPDPVKSQQNALPPGPAPGGMGDPMGGMDGMGAPPPGDPGMDPMGMGGMPPMPGNPMGAPGGVPGAPPPF